MKTFPSLSTWLGTSQSTNVTQQQGQSTSTAANFGTLNGITTAGNTISLCGHGSTYTNCSICNIMYPGQGTQGGQGILIGGATSVGTWSGSPGGPPLTQEEQAKLAQLKQEQQLETKALKKQKFRETHPHLREMIIALLAWQQICQEISSTEAPKSQEQINLENKEINSKSFSLMGMPVTAGWNGQFPLVTPPEGLTADDLKEAHADAAFEEEILDTKE
jgi:hypothetical protein